MFTKADLNQETENGEGLETPKFALSGRHIHKYAKRKLKTGRSSLAF